MPAAAAFLAHPTGEFTSPGIHESGLNRLPGSHGGLAVASWIIREPCGANYLQFSGLNPLITGSDPKNGRYLGPQDLQAEERLWGDVSLHNPCPGGAFDKPLCAPSATVALRSHPKNPKKNGRGALHKPVDLQSTIFSNAFPAE